MSSAQKNVGMAFSLFLIIILIIIIYYYIYFLWGGANE